MTTPDRSPNPRIRAIGSSLLEALGPEWVTSRPESVDLPFAHAVWTHGKGKKQELLAEVGDLLLLRRTNYAVRVYAAPDPIFWLVGFEYLPNDHVIEQLLGDDESAWSDPDLQGAWFRAKDRHRNLWGTRGRIDGVARDRSVAISDRS